MEAEQLSVSDNLGGAPVSRSHRFVKWLVWSEEVIYATCSTIWKTILTDQKSPSTSRLPTSHLAAPPLSSPKDGYSTKPTWATGKARLPRVTLSKPPPMLQHQGHEHQSWFKQAMLSRLVNMKYIQNKFLVVKANATSVSGLYDEITWNHHVCPPKFLRANIPFHWPNLTGSLNIVDINGHCPATCHLAVGNLPLSSHPWCRLQYPQVVVGYCISNFKGPNNCIIIICFNISLVTLKWTGIEHKQQEKCQQKLDQKSTSIKFNQTIL